MPVTALHWDVGKNTRIFRQKGVGEEARLHVLINLMARANIRNRCWPSVETIMKDTGFTHKQSISASIQWLVEHGAIYIVPYDKRVGEEIRLPRRKYVYQLNGIIKIGEKVFEYLVMKPEERDQMISELEEVGAEWPLALYGTVNEPTSNGYGSVAEPNYSSVSAAQSSIPSLQSLPEKDSTPPSAESMPAALEPAALDEEENTWPDPWLVAIQPPKKDDIQEHALVKYMVGLNGNKPLSKTKMKSLTTEIPALDNGAWCTFPSLVDCYDTYPGFSDFVNERISHFKALWDGNSLAPDVKNLLSNLRNFNQRDEKKWPGWLKWKELNKAFLNQMAAAKQEPVTRGEYAPGWATGEDE